MRRNLGMIIGILGLLAAAAGAYSWATAMMDSVYAYRSPLAASPPAPGSPLSDHESYARLTGGVVIVLIDALRLDTSLDPEVMPVLSGLRAQGASAAMRSRPPSFSEPGYTTILTGAWPDINDGPPVNLDYNEIHPFTQDDLFSAVHRAGWRTAISGYYWFEKLVPQEAVDASFYTPGEDAAADREVLDAALPWLGQSYGLVLIHIDQVDYAGHHQGGPRGHQWNEAASRADAMLGEVLAATDLQEDTLLVISDHGQIDRGGHGGPEPVTLTEPFVLAGAGVRPGSYPDVQMADLAPTLAALLGANLPASNEGHVLTDMLDLDGTQVQLIQGALEAQQARLAQAYGTAIGQTVSVPPDASDVVAATGQAMARARAARLGRERILPAALAVILALLPGAILVEQRDKRWPWVLAGALIFVLLFNLRYAILDGRTYSLSSVDSQEWLIGYVAPTAAFALLAGWLAVVLGMRLFARRGDGAGPRRAAAATLRLVWLTVYLLALPALAHLAVNGPLTTWTLPEFYTSYLALFSLIQIIIVAACGLLLTGLAAGIARVVAR